MQNYNISSDTMVYIGGKTTLPMSQINENIPRLEKAWKLFEEGKVYLSRKNPLKAVVKGTKDYAVNIATQSCTCDDHKYRPELVCCHIRAVQLARDIQLGLITLEVKN